MHRRLGRQRSEPGADLTTAWPAFALTSGALRDNAGVMHCAPLDSSNRLEGNGWLSKSIQAMAILRVSFMDARPATCPNA